MKGETKFDKIKNINDYVYKKFCEEREKNSCITTRNLREWAIQRSIQYESSDFDFDASLS